eukprot:gene2021-5094_t
MTNGVVLVLLGSLLAVACAQTKRSALFHDSNGTTHLVSPNADAPFAINGIDIFTAMRTMVDCIKGPCPAGEYRTGLIEHIGGHVRLFSNFVTELDFANIKYIGGLQMQNNRLSSINFGTITSISGSLDLETTTQVIRFSPKAAKYIAQRC